MLMSLEPLLGAIASLESPGPILQMSPCGRPLSADLARDLSHSADITLLCGRYEGIDARLSSFCPSFEVSVCQAVLNGGETAALAVIEAVCRFAPGFLGKDESSDDETFKDGLLEYPQYTRPENYEGREAPKILLSGNHAAIAEWRRNASLEKTLTHNPRLLDSARLDKKDADFLAGLPRLRPGRNLSFCLCHYPVRLEGGRTGHSSLTNLDAHDIGRISRSYGMGPFFILLSLKEQRVILDNILSHWMGRQGAYDDRKKAIAQIIPVSGFAELEERAADYYGARPAFIASSAAWPDKKMRRQLLTPSDVRALCQEKPVIILLGTARGLDLKALPMEFSLLRPLRFLDENHLSVRAAAAVMADRILGDFY